MALRESHASPRAMAVGSSLESQARGVASMVRSLSEGVGPEARDVSSFGEFYTLCVLKLVSFSRTSRSIVWLRALLENLGFFTAGKL